METWRSRSLAELDVVYVAGPNSQPRTPHVRLLHGSPWLRPRARCLPLRRVLAEVVQSGTARRVAGAFQEPGGKPIVVGGKTGSGDNRFDTFASRGRLISSRPVSRTAAFVFYVGDRYFGIITASVAGKAAGQYQFTSALPLTVLRLLAPQINARAPRDVVASPAAPPLIAQAQNHRLRR